MEQLSQTITIKTIEGTEIPINMEASKLSQTIKDMLDIYEEADESIIPMLNDKCTTEVMLKIKEYVECYHAHHNDDTFSAWTKNFVQVESQLLFNMIIVSDYLHISFLTDTIAQEIANRLVQSTDPYFQAFIN